MSGHGNQLTSPGQHCYGDRDAGPREFEPHNFGPQESHTWDFRLHQPAPHDSDPRNSAPHDFVPRDSGQRDLNPWELRSPGFLSNHNAKQEFGARDSGPRDFGLRQPGPSDYGVCDPGPIDFVPTRPGLQHFGPRGYGPKDFGLRHPRPSDYGACESGPRDYRPGPQELSTYDSRVRDFGPGPQEFGPRDSGSKDFGPHNPGPQNFGPSDSGPRDFGSHHPAPQEFGTRHSGMSDLSLRHPGQMDYGVCDSGEREFVPQHPGSQAFGPSYTGPMDFGPHHPGPKVFGPSNPGQRDYDLHQSGPQEFGPRESGPRDFGHIYSQAFSPSNSGPKDFGPCDTRLREFSPRFAESRYSGPCVSSPSNNRLCDSALQDFRPGGGSHEIFPPGDQPPQPSYERPGSPLLLGDSPSDQRGNEKISELIIRTTAVEQITQQIGRHRPDLIGNEMFLMDLSVLLLQRLKSIFGSGCGHKVRDITRGYRYSYPPSTDMALLEELLRRKRATGGFYGPPSKPHHIENKPEDRPGPYGPPSKQRHIENKPENRPGPYGPPSKQRHIENKPENRPVPVVPGIFPKNPEGAPVVTAKFPKYPEGNKKKYSDYMAVDCTSQSETSAYVTAQHNCAERKLVKSEFGNQSQYTLPTALRRALDTELDQIMQMVWEDLPETSPLEPERIAIEALKGNLGETLRHIIDLHATKRILKINTNLAVRIFGIPRMPKKAVIKEFLSEYKVTALKKSAKSKMLVATMPDHYEYDRLCQLGSVLMAGQLTVKFKPLHLAGPKRVSKKV